MSSLEEHLEDMEWYLNRSQGTQNAESPLISFFTDAEGNLEFFKRFASLSNVVEMVEGSDSPHFPELRFRRHYVQDHFVFGGDAFDKGDGDIRIASMLTDFKDREPERVHLILGNRDVNKLRLAAELSDDECHRPVDDLSFTLTAQQSYREYLEALAPASQDGIEKLNTKPNRLRWILYDGGEGSI